MSGCIEPPDLSAALAAPPLPCVDGSAHSNYAADTICDGSIDVEGELLPSACGGGACHGVNNPQLGIDLESPGIVTRYASQFSRLPGCEHRQLVDLAQPECSYLLEKTTPDPSCGDAMPFGGDGLDPMAYACLRDWLVSQRR